jgi:hypothetical protein
MATSTEKTKDSTADMLALTSSDSVVRFVGHTRQGSFAFWGLKTENFSGKIMFALHAKFSVFNVCQTHTWLVFVATQTTF